MLAQDLTLSREDAKRKAVIVDKLVIYIIIYAVYHVRTTNTTFCTFRGLHKTRNC